MISLMSSRQREETPGLPGAASKQDCSKAPTVPRADGLAVTEMPFIHKSAFMRAQGRPNFNLISALASEQQFDRTPRNAVHAMPAEERTLTSGVLSKLAR
jgi:hypothetical protein